MVYHGHQHMLVVGDAEKLGAEGDFVCEFECVAGRGAEGGTQPICRPPTGIDDVPARGGQSAVARSAGTTT